MFKILVVDDDTAFRHAVNGLIHEQFPMIEVREANNGREALQQIAGADLVFVDISLADENGLDLATRIKSEDPRFTVSILTIHDSPEYQEAAFQHGADYFVSKGAPAEKILEVVRSTLARTDRNLALSQQGAASAQKNSAQPLPSGNGGASETPGPSP